MNAHDRHRLQFGLSAAFIIFAVLVVHVVGLVKLDNVALGLLAGAGAGLLFALAERLGIKKITAGSATVELAEYAAKAITANQRGEYSEVLERNSDVFPVIGARILWVDDRPEKLIAHRQVLRRLGIQVIFVTSTEEAVSEIKRDSDFALMIQDYLRHGNDADAKKLLRWVDTEGKDNYEILAPLVVYSYDSFDKSVGVQKEDWITQDFSILLKRVAKEMRAWRERFPRAQGKSPA